MSDRAKGACSDQAAASAPDLSARWIFVPNPIGVSNSGNNFSRTWTVPHPPAEAKLAGGEEDS
jgi:hypothetical protein